MENNHFVDLDESKIKKERPTFLTVLCIITFIVSGLWFLSSFFGVLTYDQLAQEEAMELALVAMEDAMSAQSSSPMGDKVMDSYVLMLNEQLQYHTLINWSTVISTLLSLIGAYLMFTMRKIGFHVYLVSKIVGLIPLTVFSMSMIVIGAYAIFGIFTIAFLIMYAVNLKHMKSA